MLDDNLPDRLDCLEAVEGKYIIDPESGCWNSIMCVDSKGYTQIWIKKRMYKMHRILFFIYNNYLDTELLICHTCDNKKCCNPDHLFIGTAKDNAQDCLNKGRWNDNKGSNHGNSKLTEKQVLEIKYQLKLGLLNQRQLAEIYSVHNTIISKIKNGKLWSHI